MPRRAARVADPAVVRAVVQRVAQADASGRPTVEVEGRAGDLLVAAATGINRCMLTRIRPAGSAVRFHTVEALPVGSAGCHRHAWFDGF